MIYSYFIKNKLNILDTITHTVKRVYLSSYIFPNRKTIKIIIIKLHLKEIIFNCSEYY